MRVLLVEGRKEISRFLKKGLEVECFAVDVTDTVDHALALIGVNEYDVILLTTTIEDKDNIKLCAKLLNGQKPIPNIVLSDDKDLEAKIEAFQAGADDYIIRPFSFSELLARIQALLRRGKKLKGPKLGVGDLELDCHRHIVKRGKEVIKLNKKEFALLEYLMRNLGRVLTRVMILEHVWDMNANPFTNTIDVHIKHLREKINKKTKRKLIHTVHGYGYKLE